MDIRALMQEGDDEHEQASQSENFHYPTAPGVPTSMQGPPYHQSNDPQTQVAAAAEAYHAQQQLQRLPLNNSSPSLSDISNSSKTTSRGKSTADSKRDFTRCMYEAFLQCEPARRREIEEIFRQLKTIAGLNRDTALGQDLVRRAYHRAAELMAQGGARHSQRQQHQQQRRQQQQQQQQPQQTQLHSQHPQHSHSHHHTPPQQQQQPHQPHPPQQHQQQQQQPVPVAVASSQEPSTSVSPLMAPYQNPVDPRAFMATLPPQTQQQLLALPPQFQHQYLQQLAQQQQQIRYATQASQSQQPLSQDPSQANSHKRPAESPDPLPRSRSRRQPSMQLDPTQQAPQPLASPASATRSRTALAAATAAEAATRTALPSRASGRIAGRHDGRAEVSPHQQQQQQLLLQQQQQQHATQPQQPPARQHQVEQMQTMGGTLMDDPDLIDAAQATGEEIETDIAAEKDLEAIVQQEDEALLGQPVQPMRQFTSAEQEMWQFRHVWDQAATERVLHDVQERLRPGTAQGLDPLAVELLSRAAQEYATGLMEKLVEYARQRANNDVRSLLDQQGHGVKLRWAESWPGESHVFRKGPRRRIQTQDVLRWLEQSKQGHAHSRLLDIIAHLSVSFAQLRKYSRERKEWLKQMAVRQEQQKQSELG